MNLYMNGRSGYEPEHERKERIWTWTWTEGADMNLYVTGRFDILLLINQCPMYLFYKVIIHKSELITKNCPLICATANMAVWHHWTTWFYDIEPTPEVYVEHINMQYKTKNTWFCDDSTKCRAHNFAILNVEHMTAIHNVEHLIISKRFIHSSLIRQILWNIIMLWVHESVM